MPVFSRQSLRRALGQAWLYDTVVGTTTLSAATGAPAVMDGQFADLSFSGMNLHQRSWFRHSGTALDYRTASFNVASGAFVSTAQVGGVAPSGATFEVASLLAPADKDRALDDALQRIRVQQEVGITTFSGAKFYDLDLAASPHRIAKVLGAYVFADPSNTLNRDRRDFSTPPQVVNTATGVEIRLDSDLSLSSLLVVDALLELTLAGGDAATINIPDERWVLAGAAAKAWDLLAQKAPGSNAAQYRSNRDDAARTFSDLSSRYKPTTSVRLGFETPF